MADEGEQAGTGGPVSHTHNSMSGDAEIAVQVGTARDVVINVADTVSPAAAAVAADVTEEQAARGLDDLVEASLLEEIDSERFEAHAMIRAHAVHLATHAYSDAERTGVTRRLVEWYLACGQAADRAVAAERTRLPGQAVRLPAAVSLPTFADDRAALDWLEAEHTALLGSQRIAAEHEWDELLWLLCDPLWALNQNHRHPSAWIEALTRGIAAAEHAGSRWVCVRLRCLLSRAFVDLAEFDRAAGALAGALDLARLETDAILEASVLKPTRFNATWRAGRTPGRKQTRSPQRRPRAHALRCAAA